MSFMDQINKSFAAGVKPFQNAINAVEIIAKGSKEVEQQKVHEEMRDFD